MRQQRTISHIWSLCCMVVSSWPCSANPEEVLHVLHSYEFRKFKHCWLSWILRLIYFCWLQIISMGTIIPSNICHRLCSTLSVAIYLSSYTTVCYPDEHPENKSILLHSWSEVWIGPGTVNSCMDCLKMDQSIIILLFISSGWFIKYCCNQTFTMDILTKRLICPMILQLPLCGSNLG